MGQISLTQNHLRLIARASRFDHSQGMQNTFAFDEALPVRDDLEVQLLARSMALSIAKDAVAASQRARTSFLNNMSHELRTPLSSIIGLTGLACGRATDAKQAEQLGKVQHAAEQLLTLVTDMLDLSELESRQLGLTYAPFQLGVVLDGLHQRAMQEANKKGLVLVFDTPANLHDLALQGDPLRLGQVLLALTGNAIKFTEQGSVDVRASLAEQTPDDVVLRFEVQDTGIGIAAVDQKRLFGLFEQIDDSPTRRHGGAGVGLALSKKLIELMGGSIGVDSQPGGGSVFWFTVRLDKLYRQPCAISNRDSAARVYLDDAARQDRFIGLQEAKALVHQLRLRQAELELECAALRQRVAA